MITAKKIIRLPHFMIMPTLSCPADCHYCFSPHQGTVMSSSVLDQTVKFIKAISGDKEKVKITFHGGEPLAAGPAFWEAALSKLDRYFGQQGLKLTVQSNLWLFNEGYARLFKQYGVHIGTSLDGPQAITDRQRGDGYYEQTMKGLKLADQYGFYPGVISTFTKTSSAYWEEIIDFFEQQQLKLIIHPAVNPIKQKPGSESLKPAEYKTLLLQLLNAYKKRRKKMRSPSLDQLIRSVAFGSGQVCTYKECLGMFLAIDPGGFIYPCQRFAGVKQYQLGHVDELLNLEQLMSRPVALKMAEREQKVVEQCRACNFLSYCYGGCYYNAVASGDKRIDPYCEAYKGIYHAISKELLDEFKQEKNFQALVNKQVSCQKDHPLLHQGPLSELANKKAHPFDMARNARRLVAAVELARAKDYHSLINRLLKKGICQTEESAEVSVNGLKKHLNPEKTILNNLYIHITFRCQLQCSHCYAHAGTDSSSDEMEPEVIMTLIKEAEQSGFRQVVITGGEPLCHQHIKTILDRLTDNKKDRTVKLILRSNFSIAMDNQLMKKLANSFDQLVVSLDGDEATHDNRRGQGNYQKVVKQLSIYQDLYSAKPGAAQCSLAAVLSKEEVKGKAGRHLKTLAEEMNINRLRFRPVLPIGRAAARTERAQAESLAVIDEPAAFLEAGYLPVRSCGLGKNLYIEPSGQAFPCYAFHQSHSLVGNIHDKGLNGIIGSRSFKDLSNHHVDSNPKCSKCDMKYLCGGACRAWGREKTQHCLDAAPPDCESLYQKALTIYEAAKAYLKD